MSEEIIGGVSPLKRRAGGKSSRGGKAARKVTKKATGKGLVSGYKGRGGYKKSGGGVNPGGYNVHTRFKPRAKQEGPKGGGGGTDPKTNKPYSFDENGDIVINNNNYINTNGGTQSQSQSQSQSQTQTQTNNVEKENEEITENNDKIRSGTENRTKKGKLPTYQESWDKDNKGVRTSGDYKTFEEYEKAAIAWNRKNGVKTSSYGESRSWEQKQTDGVWGDKTYTDWKKD